MQGDIAIKVQGNPAHPATHGVLCTKVSRYPEPHLPSRAGAAPTAPHGPQGTGQFRRVTWDAALADIASRLGATAQRNPEAIGPYSYAVTTGLVQGESMNRRFFHALGASQLDRTICASAGGEGLLHTLGARMGTRVEFFAETQLIVIWGGNAIVSNLHFLALCAGSQAQRRTAGVH